jgi:flagellar motor switch protein FliM
MAEVLDQNEIDALLAAVDTGEVKQEREQIQIFSRNRRDLDTVEVRAYDFKRPERVSKDQMRSLHTLHESFARNFGASLSGFLRTIVEVKVASCEQMTYAEFIGGLPNPTSFNLMEAPPLEGQMCLEISPLIIYPIIDRLLGGTNSELFIPQRPMTQIEARLISKITDRALSTLAEAWASIKALKFEITATESNPQLVQIVPPNEVVVVVGFEVKLSNRAGTMSLCIPYNVIEPIMGELAAQSWFNVSKSGKSETHSTEISRTLKGAVVTLSGVLAETTITLGDLVSLSVGDLIVTEKPATDPVTVRVEEESSYVARMGQFKGIRALRIMRSIPTGERD